jgi:hypothetical protein
MLSYNSLTKRNVPNTPVIAFETNKRCELYKNLHELTKNKGVTFIITKKGIK